MDTVAWLAVKPSSFPKAVIHRSPPFIWQQQHSSIITPPFGFNYLFTSFYSLSAPRAAGLPKRVVLPTYLLPNLLFASRETSAYSVILPTQKC